MNMRKQILDILDRLKENKIPVSRVEKELGLANGYLGKIRDDENRNLSEDNFNKLIAFAEENNCSPIKKETMQETVQTKMVVTPTGSLSLKPSNEKLEALKKTMDSLNKDYGAGSVMILGEKQSQDVGFISTGSLSLNLALGIGGFPKGRIIEIYGQESSGKTTLAIHAIAEAQKLGGKCAIIDAEHAFDKDYAAALGVKIDELYISQPDYGEQALEIADRLTMSASFSVIVIDSVAALVPKSELEGEMGDSKMGLHARLMSQALRKMTATVSKTNTILIFINQLREKIGVIYGSPYVPTGGNALKFYASVRLDVSKAQNSKMMDGDEQYGTKTKVKVVKNKVAPPFKMAEFDIIFGKGIDYLGELIDISTHFQIIEKSGSWYSYNGSKMGQGREAVKGFLKDNPLVVTEIESNLDKSLKSV